MSSQINFTFLFVVFLIIFLLCNHTQYKRVLVHNPPLSECSCENINNCFFKNYIDINKLNHNKIFIHISQERNERVWESFMSRTSNDLNLDICALCIESVIIHFSKYFDIVLYTNDDVSDILANDCDHIVNKDYKLLSGIQLSQWESYCKFKILYKYGGIVMNPSFLFNKCPSNSNILQPNELTICEIQNEGTNVSNYQHIPDAHHMAISSKENPDVKLFLDF